MKIILASGSPRRRQLMEGLDIPFEVECSGDVAEIIPEGMPPEKTPEYLARLKSETFRPLAGDELLITADTVVVCNRQLLGKPAGKADAQRMLHLLSGNRHEVFTGVCLRTPNTTHSFTDRTTVFFRHLSAEEINYYIDRYRPCDKAGAYGAQEWIGYVGIERIEGSYFNVMGLPLQPLYGALQKLMR
ncbi:MAG: Maf family nucleotide pyrophosphatase [Prevotellaceae bacterium]|jgi:septum formation protein|nr:Maf family nucleotide pyrophosphatase [Prevotellaceae bacterium]